MPKIKLSFLLLLFALGHHTFGQTRTALKPDSAEMLRRVRKKIDSLSNAIKNTSDNNILANLYASRAMGEGLLNQTDNAISDYTRAVTLNSKLGDVYFYRGVIYQKIKNYEKGIEDYQKALAFFGNNPVRASTLYSSIGFCQLRLKNYDQALKADSTALQLSPNNAFAEATSGYVYLYTKKFEPAITAFTSSLSKYRTNNKKLIADIVNGRADAERYLHKNLDAINDYSLVIRLDPNYKRAYWNRAACYNQNGDYQLADEGYTKAISFYQGDSVNLAKLYDDRASMEIQEMKYPKALRDDSIALLYDNKYPDAYWDKSVAYAENADFDQSIAAYKQALNFYKENKYAAASVYDGIANEYYFMGKYDDAIKASSQALSLNNQLWSSWLTRGRAYLKKDQKDSAMADFNKVATADTIKGSYEYSFALFYTGNPEKAVRTMQSNIIATTNPTLEIIHYYNLACLFSLMNKPDEAAAYLKRCIDAGYYKKYILNDPDMENIRNSAQFKEVIGGK